MWVKRYSCLVEMEGEGKSQIPYRNLEALNIPWQKKTGSSAMSNPWGGDWQWQQPHAMISGVLCCYETACCPSDPPAGCFSKNFFVLLLVFCLYISFAFKIIKILPNHDFIWTCLAHSRRGKWTDFSVFLLKLGRPVLFLDQSNRMKELR